MKPQFDYPEIEQLNDVFVQYKFSWKTDRSNLLGGKSYYPKIDFSFRGKQFSLFIDDEYDDLKKNYPLLVLCLVLRELEGYEFTSEYETWCRERFLDAKDKTIESSFENLKYTYREVEKILGKIDSFVSDFDFEMNARAAQSLRRSA